MNKLKKVYNMSEEEKANLAKICGSTIVMIEEGRSDKYMSDNLNLPIWQVDANIQETLYVLRKHIGRWKFFKILFME